MEYSPGLLGWKMGGSTKKTRLHGPARGPGQCQLRGGGNHKHDIVGQA